MKIEFTVPFGALSPRTSLTETAPEPQGNPPRIARLLALAHKLDAQVRSGAIAVYGELARLGHISPARLTQIVVLLHTPVDRVRHCWAASAIAKNLCYTQNWPRHPCSRYPCT